MYLRIAILLTALAGAFPLIAKPIVVVTTTLIASAVQDLTGDAFEIITLMPAGTCPGQFDLDPRQAAQVAHADLIIRHDMQGFLDRLFVAAGAKPESVIAPKGSFTIPSAYLVYCEKIAAELRHRTPDLSPLVDSRLGALAKRSEILSGELKASAAPLAGTPVVTAMFQADLLKWLDFRVVAIFPPTDDPSPAMLQRAVKSGSDGAAVLLVGNQQNGTRIPETLANAIGVPCVMLSNFPVEAGPGAQERLMRSNIEKLLAWKRAGSRVPAADGLH